MRTGRPPVDPAIRFARQYVVHIESGCWLWIGAKSQDGYGRMGFGKLPNGRTRSFNAHRASWILHVGPIPEGLQLDHLCRVRHCVNYKHLEPVTAKVNSLRSESPAAKASRRNHCKWGHEYTPENLAYKSDGRVCRRCQRDRGARYRRSA